MTYTIVFEDKDIVIINKPCGIAVESKDNDIIKDFKQKQNKSLFSITRLDQPVSGLVLFAKNNKSANKYSELLNNKGIVKTYIAIVEGKVDQSIQSVVHKISKRGQKAVIDQENGKHSELKIIENTHLDNYSRLKIITSTGRFHQIRIQLSELGHPIKGDLKYGSKRSNKEGGIYLHCYRMKITTPSGDLKIFEAPFPEEKNLYKI